MILDTIVASTRLALAARRAARPERALGESLSVLSPTLDVVGALRRRSGVNIIAEVKRASPSRGALNAHLVPADLAATYACAGAAAVSVLTEGRFFRGSLDDLRTARQGLARAGRVCPLLCKDFILERYQLLEARLAGADAVLLIAAILEDGPLAALFEQALELGLTPLVEVHDERELGRALRLDPPLVGINNRNLGDFTVNLETTRLLRPLAPAAAVVVAESGIHSATEMSALASWGVDAALIGEALVSAPDPAARLRELLEAGR